MNVLRAVAVGLLVTCSSPATGQVVTATRVAVLPFRPTAICSAPGVQHQFYVAVKNGRVWVVRGSAVISTPALDHLWAINQNGEGGLLGMAFHPDFATNRKLYLCYTQTGVFGDTVVSEFTMVAGTVDRIDTNSERILVGPIPQTSNGHKAGDLEFGPDGMLYVALGDGDAGSASNSSIAQDLGSKLGKILRVDVDAPAPHVPLDNPFVATPGAEPLVWAYGVRNPWRIGVDAATGSVFVGDVGASAFEELTRIDVADAGANLGWPCREGLQCRSHTACACPGASLFDPFHVLAHGGSPAVCAIIGGDVLRGCDIPRLEGQYIFADFCAPSLWMIEDPYGAANLVDLYAELGPAEQASLRNVSEFGQGPSGELLVGTHYTQEIWRIRARPGFQPYCTAAPNSTGGPATLLASGSASISAANLRLDLTGLPPGAHGLMLIGRGRTYIEMVAGLPGTLCVTGAPVYRWVDRVLTASGTGSASLVTDLTDLPWGSLPVPGDTWNFQYWTRDANPLPTANMSTAVAVTFAP
jgi:glucose/arabinose dehydrogenase